MRALYAAAVLLLAATSRGLAEEQNEFKTAGTFVDTYQKNNNIYMRLYIRGIGEGIGIYNAMLDQPDGGRKLYCPPGNVGIVDAQYVAIMSSFLTKYPTTRSHPVPAVLLFALKEAFPCGEQ
jgi:hypothetical protein